MGIVCCLWVFDCCLEELNVLLIKKKKKKGNEYRT